MKLLISILVILLISLQSRLWIGEGSLAQLSSLKKGIEQQQQTNQRLRERNKVLDVQVQELKSGLDSVEELARNEQGMIQRGETFFLVIDS